MRTRPLRSIPILLAAVVALQACAAEAGSAPSGSSQGGPPAVDRAGDQTVTLRLPVIDDVNGNGVSYGTEAFVKAVDDVSGGHLKLDVTTAFANGASDADSQLATAISTGNADLGWPATRGFANAGIHGLEAVEAPMTLTSYDAVKALVTSPAAGDLLAQLDGTGMVGLGLLVDTLRRPFATTAPLLGPEDWSGIRFRSFGSPIQSAAVTALGGTPVDLGGQWIDQLGAGTLRGAEFDIPQYAWNGFTTETPFVTANVVLWPKVYVLAVNRQRFEALTDQQRAWLRDAAQAAIKASVDATYDESTLASGLCAVGVRFVPASYWQLAGAQGQARTGYRAAGGRPRQRTAAQGDPGRRGPASRHRRPRRRGRLQPGRRRPRQARRHRRSPRPPPRSPMARIARPSRMADLAAAGFRATDPGSPASGRSRSATAHTPVVQLR